MTDKTEGAPKAASGALCVICGAHPQTEKYRPFCSKRCADIDLHRWFGGRYVIPGKPEEEEDEGDTRGEAEGG